MRVRCAYCMHAACRTTSARASCSRHSTSLREAARTADILFALSFPMLSGAAKILTLVRKMQFAQGFFSKWSSWLTAKLFIDSNKRRRCTAVYAETGAEWHARVGNGSFLAEMSDRCSGVFAYGCIPFVRFAVWRFLRRGHKTIAAVTVWPATLCRWRRCVTFSLNVERRLRRIRICCLILGRIRNTICYG